MPELTFTVGIGVVTGAGVAAGVPAAKRLLTAPFMLTSAGGWLGVGVVVAPLSIDRSDETGVAELGAGVVAPFSAEKSEETGVGELAPVTRVTNDPAAAGAGVSARGVDVPNEKLSAPLATGVGAGFVGVAVVVGLGSAKPIGKRSRVRG